MSTPENRHYLKQLLILLALLLGARLAVAALLPLSPQEAYYWVFSLHPAWSYFDHPPLTAYVIGFFTYFLGDRAVVIRLGALLFSFGFSLLAYFLAKELFDSRVGFRTGAISALLPSYAITALIITPDSPLVFFWTLSVFLTLKAIQNDRYHYHLLSGVSLGLALLSKYTAVLFPASLLLFFLFTPDQRRHLKRWELYGGWVLAALIFSPVFLWNANHDWASFAFQSTDRARELGKFSPGDLGAFLASQAGVVTPLVFAGMAVTLGLAVKRFFRRPSWKENYLLFLSLPMIGLFTLVATREWVKMNWLIPAYLPLIILMMRYYQERIFAWKWVYRGIAAWTWVTVGLFFILLHLWPFVPQIKVSGSMDTLTGWRELAGHLQKVQQKIQKESGPKPQSFILAWGHKTASELWFELRGHPPVYAQTALGKNALAYDFWFDPAPLQGQDALFVWSSFENFSYESSDLLTRYCEKVEPLEPFTVYRGKHPLRTFHIVHCTRYRGFDFKKP
jgi:4-amino-4-deoxy-L-arabinose transferase-like glycosyltransferase